MLAAQAAHAHALVLRAVAVREVGERARLEDHRLGARVLNRNAELELRRRHDYVGVVAVVLHLLFLVLLLLRRRRFVFLLARVVFRVAHVGRKLAALLLVAVDRVIVTVELDLGV